MCGRFININKLKKLKKIFEIEINDINENISYNISPSQKVNIILNNNELTIENLNWGLKFTDKNNNLINIINSRLETINEKLIFKDSFIKRRCIIPANGYYEWLYKNGKKTPYFIEVPKQEMIFFAGIWKYSKKLSENIKTFSIITKVSNNIINKIHKRMPVILSIEEAKSYIDEDNINFLNNEFISILEQYLEFYPVSDIVNSPKNNFIECIKSLI